MAQTSRSLRQVVEPTTLRRAVAPGWGGRVGAHSCHHRLGHLAHGRVDGVVAGAGGRGHHRPGAVRA